MGPIRFPARRVTAGAMLAALFAAGASAALAGPASAAGLAVDGSVMTHQAAAATTITSGALNTTQPGDLVLAFLASDGPNRAGGVSFQSVSGGGLTWKLRQRTNAQAGTAEIWQAVAPNPLTNVTITATRSGGSYVGLIDVVAFSGANTTATTATGTASAASGAPSATLTTTSAGSLVWGVGDDWDAAVARTPGSGQTVFDTDLASVGDTYWVQSRSGAAGAAGSPVAINDTAPSGDRFDLSTVEIAPAVVDTQAPSVPQGLTGTAPGSNLVTLSWSPSTDNVGVAGYTVLRNGSPIGSSTTTNYSDTTVNPSTPYTYTVEAYDAAGNVSAPSTPFMITTPAASANPPVISGVTVSAITTSGATISWTTDIPSSTQVLYGTSLPYSQSTTLNSAQVTSHSQTLSGLTANTPYHYAVQSTGSSANTATSPDATFTTAAATVTPPDMQLEVPTNAISIGTNGSNGHRQLQFTHITWDAGAGPFEIDPTYNSSTGTSSFSQEIYRMTSPGNWIPDHSVPLAVGGVFDAPSDYQFPLTRFTLNRANPDGSPGAVVATSPKTDYCITADTYVGGVANAPNETYIPQSNCDDPTRPLGWSVGWGDEYDQTDSGQPIDLTGVADGTYILQGTVDPQHVLTESDPTNNVTDTTVQIAGSSVTVVSQSNPAVTPPTVSVTNPAAGSSVSGTVTVQASATANAPATVSSVQFLLDGQPLGAPVTAAPYSYSWSVGATSLGSHRLSARVTDSNGTTGTAAPVAVTVVSGGGGGGTPPSLTISNPTANQTVSGTTPVAATVTAGSAPIASVQFYLDGAALGSPVTSAPYAINWDTTAASNTTHVLSAVATDTAGATGTAPNVSVTVQNPAPPMTCFVMQAQVSAHGTGTVTTPAFHTAAPGEVLLAFVATDGPNSSGSQTVTVTGAGLTWKLVKRANAQAGDSEIWSATAPSVLTSATATSTEARGGFAQDLTVIAMEGVSGLGATAGASAASGAPSLSLTTTKATSLVFAVGNDWDRAIGRTLPAGWVMLDQWINTGSGDDYWSQYTNTPTGAAGTKVTVSDTAPTGDRWNLAAVELLNDGG